ncbi:MAG: PDZ domain-containing protein, partial [Myxococcota bacterium]
VCPMPRNRRRRGVWRLRPQPSESAASGEPLRGGELTLADGTAVPIGSDGRFEFTHDGPVSIVALRGPGVGDLFEGGRNRIDILEPLAGLVLHAMPASKKGVSKKAPPRRELNGSLGGVSQAPVWLEAEPVERPGDIVARELWSPKLGAQTFSLSTTYPGPVRVLAFQDNRVAVSGPASRVLLELPPGAPFKVSLDGLATLGPVYVALEWLGQRSARVLHQRVVFGATAVLDFGGVGPGRYRVTLRRADGASTQGEIDLGTGAHPELRLSWQPGATLTGVLTDARGAPVAGGRVQMLDAKGLDWVPSAPWSLSGADGAFALSSIPEGERAFVVTAPGFEPRITEPRRSRGEGELRPLMVRLTGHRFAVAQVKDGSGIGAEFKPRVYELMVASVAEQGGAQEAGLRPGDRVVAVQGQPVSEIGYQRALRRLKGPEGTAVEVEVRPVGSKATEILRVERRNGYVDRVR